MNRALIDQKLESLRHALQRVSDKCPESVEVLASDFDAQDIVSLNLTRAELLSIKESVSSFPKLLLGNACQSALLTGRHSGAVDSCVPKPELSACFKSVINS